MKIVNASIITIGDELLIGQTIDTNSAFIAQELNRIGVWVRRRVAVGDLAAEIRQALDEESAGSDIIILTGGLGPTADDITKPLLCDYFGGKLVVNEKVLEHVKFLFENIYRRPGPILERNLRQAEVPDVCTVLHNARGTAPGMLFKKIVPPITGRLNSSPNPSIEGALNPENSDMPYGYVTADPVVYEALKKFLDENRKNPTEAESVLWEIIRGKKLSGYKFRRQHIIGSFIADFVCLPAKLIIEVDGLIHQLPENLVTDQERTRILHEQGFAVIRFTSDQVLQDADTVINSILTILKKNLPDPGSENPPLEGREVLFFSLPGVPHEMKGLMTGEVIPRLLEAFTLPAIVHRTAFTAGQGESVIAERLQDFEPALPAHIKLAYLPNYGMVKLRLTATGESKEKLEKEITPWFENLQERVKEWLVTNEDKGLEVVIGEILKAKNKTMGTAESCTGGYIAHLITSVPGSSEYYKGSVISYANETKENLLSVDPETLTLFGAVSEQTVREMVQGALHSLKVDYALATSGIMGPDGGTKEKPVGTVWIAAGNKDKTETLRLNLRFDRQRNTEMTAANALNFLRKFILAH